MKITEVRNKSKFQVCERILTYYKIYQDSGSTSGFIPVASGSNSHRINKFCLMNIIFKHPEFLDECAAALKKKDLDKQTKNGQKFFVKLIKEYILSTWITIVIILKNMFLEYLLIQLVSHLY